jgi:hypothetical protein
MCKTREDGWWAGLGLKETSGPRRANLIMPYFFWSAHNMHVKEESISPHAFFENCTYPHLWFGCTQMHFKNLLTRDI